MDRWTPARLVHYKLKVTYNLVGTVVPSFMIVIFFIDAGKEDNY